MRKNVHNQRSSTTGISHAQSNQALTVLYKDLPAWLQDNQFIRSGYRPPSNSYRKSAASLVYIHNETVNIYTHLIGAVVAFVSAFWLHHEIRPRFERATTQDVAVFSCFFLGAVVCLGMSATYHTIANHSEVVAKFGNRLDYLGIVFLIWGSFIPSIYYGFAVDPALIKLYWTMITAIGAGTVAVIMLPGFRTPDWRSFRAGMFVAMGLSAIIPVMHGLARYGRQQLESQIGLSWLVLQGVLYVSGAVIYAARVPERWMPGVFDIWGASHQLFHILVVLAAAAHLTGLLKAFDFEHRSRLDALSARLTGNP